MVIYYGNELSHHEEKELNYKMKHWKIRCNHAKRKPAQDTQLTQFSSHPFSSRSLPEKDVNGSLFYLEHSYSSRPSKGGVKKANNNLDFCFKRWKVQRRRCLVVAGFPTFYLRASHTYMYNAFSGAPTETSLPSIKFFLHSRLWWKTEMLSFFLSSASYEEVNFQDNNTSYQYTLLAFWEWAFYEKSLRRYIQLARMKCATKVNSDFA